MVCETDEDVSPPWETRASINRVSSLRVKTERLEPENALQNDELVSGVGARKPVDAWTVAGRRNHELVVVPEGTK